MLNNKLITDPRADCKTTDTGNWSASAVDYSRAVKQIDLTLKEASRLGQRATRRCKELGITPGKVSDPRFGEVNTYPREVLSWAWNSLHAEYGWEGWDPSRRLAMQQADEDEAAACRALDEADAARGHGSLLISAQRAWKYGHGWRD
jgi:hypothetical protein